jgi:hypothetical protein
MLQHVAGELARRGDDLGLIDEVEAHEECKLPYELPRRDHVLAGPDQTDFIS